MKRLRCFAVGTISAFILDEVLHLLECSAYLMLIGAGSLVALARKQAKRGGHSHHHQALQYRFGTKVDIHLIIRRETQIVNT